MPTITIDGSSDVIGRSVAMVDETNYLAARSGSGEVMTYNEGGTGQKMNIGIRAEKSKATASPVTGLYKYTILRHILSFVLTGATAPPAGARIISASIQLTSAGVTQTLSPDPADFSYATSSISVVAASRTGLVQAGDYDSVNITDGTGDLTDRGMTFRTYDDVDSGSAVPQTSGQTVNIPLNQNAMDDLVLLSSGDSFDVGLINTKFDKGGTVANPGSFFSGSEPGAPLLSDKDVHGQFTPPGNNFGLTGTDVHHEGTYIAFFGDLGYSSGRPELTYTYELPTSAGTVTINNKIVHTSGKISHLDLFD